MDVIVVVSIYLAIASLVGFASMGLDKWKAIHRAWRIPEATLFMICILGGSLGSTLGMFVFRHKTKHWYFRWGFPVILAIHVIIAAFLIGSNDIIIM